MKDALVNKLAGEVLAGNDASRERLFAWVFDETMIYLRWKSKTYPQLRRMRLDDVALDILILFADRLHRLESPARYLKTLIKFETLKAAKRHSKYHMSHLLHYDVPNTESTEQEDPPLDDEQAGQFMVAMRILDESSELRRKCALLRMQGMGFREIAKRVGYANTQSAVSSFSAYRQQVKEAYSEIAA